MRIEVKRQMGSGDIAAVSGLLDNAARHDDHPALGDHQWVDLVHGGRQGFAGLVAWETGHDHPTGYAQVTKGPETWALEYVVDPHHRNDQRTVARAILKAALGLVAQEGGGHVHMWVPRAVEADDELARSFGLERGRELLQMRRPLPLPPEEKGVDTRAFVPGRDEEPWLEVNNRAFSWHPEQGGWDVQTLRDREGEAWFDPAGFLLHERDGRLAGFCWTKIHSDRNPPLGEIYVIAVDPDFQGLRLGRALVVSGLRYLEGRGLETGMLYVDGGNTPAVGLYKDMGFTVDHTDQAYVGDVAAAS
ncbi:MAG TPA: mycothiol synthase [Acidimicrobiales bacterium]|nr:mycothiol synthase [Acidimicrobiales bacterium]